MNRLLEKIINRTHLQDAQKADYCGFCFKHSGGHNGKRISHIRNFQVFCLPTERKLLSFWPIHAHITCAALKGVGDPPPPLENSNFIKLHSKIPENMPRVPPPPGKHYIPWNPLEKFPESAHASNFLIWEETTRVCEQAIELWRKFETCITSKISGFYI